MKRLAGALSAIAVGLAGCTGAPVAPVSGVATVTASPVGGVAADSRAWAYAAIVRWLYHQDEALNGHMMAVDAASSGLDRPEELITLLVSDATYSRHQVRMATRAELVAEGRIKDGTVTDGFLVEFANPDAGEDKVTVDATKYAANAGASGARVTAQRQGGTWVVLEPGNHWAA